MFWLYDDALAGVDGAVPHYLRSCCHLAWPFNFAVAALDLIPCFPSDGGRIVRSLLALAIARVNPGRASRAPLIATAVATQFISWPLAIGLALLTVFQTHLWLHLVLLSLVVFLGEMELRCMKAAQAKTPAEPANPVALFGPGVAEPVPRWPASPMPETSHASIDSSAPTPRRPVCRRLAMQLREPWLQAGPWLMAAAVGTVVPWIVLLVFWGMTGTFVQPVDDWGPRVLSAGQPLDFESRIFVGMALCSYGVIGLTLWLRAHSPRGDARTIVAWWLLGLAVALQLSTVPLLSTTWSLAVRHGDVPAGPWGVNAGNHGPWRWVHTLDALLAVAFALPFYAFVAAFLSRLVRHQPAFPWVVGGCLVMFLGLLGSHYWLVD